MNRFAQQRTEFKSQPDSEGTASYRPELSRGAKWKMGQERFLVVAVTKGNPHSDGTVFESRDGMRLVVKAEKTRNEADAKLISRGSGCQDLRRASRVQHAGGGVGCKRSFVLGFKGAEEISAQ